MNLKEFASVLRTMIRQEVSAAVNEELKPIKKALLELKKQNKNVLVDTYESSQAPIQRANKAASKINVKGPLGDILRETAASMMNESANEYEEWPTMGSLRTSDQVPNNFVQSRVTKKTTSSDPMASLMKDYSQVLKKAESIASQNNFQ